jgi:hypothetical protein
MPDDWVHRFHTGTATATAAGILDVDRGESRRARMLCCLLRLPPAAVGQPARLRIVRRADGAAGADGAATQERWIRTFGSVSLATRQVRTGERIAERAGPVELRMRCRTTASDVWFIPDGAAVVLGRRGFRLPAFIAPQARAHAWSSGEGAFDVDVAVRIPLLGVLLSYRGHFTEAKQ